MSEFMSRKSIFFGTQVLLAASAGAVHAAEKPLNVVLILADDLGWADTTLYGKTTLYETPNLRRLAARGVTFNRAYSASPLCSPTRASIMTGQTPARTGITSPGCHLPEVLLKASVSKKAPPGDKALQCESATRLATTLPTLGKQIKAGGYATAHFGKWHIGPEPYSPLQQGFDVDIPHWPGPGPAGSFVAPWKFKDFDADPGIPNQHLEDRMAKEAVKWMRSVADQPFYMNYWMFSVHAPFDAKQELIEKYRNKVNPAELQHCATYAAMVESMDDAVGTLLDELDRLSIADRTVIIFYSDNGGNMYNGISETDISGAAYITEATSNRPLRGGKATMFEGGIRVPCVVVWPGVTKPGSRSDALIQSTDLYPFILNVLKIPLPENYAVDGIDFSPALRDEPFERGPIFTYFPHSPMVPDWLPPAMAVHVGDWKLIRLFHQGENGAHSYLLYNLKDDIGEKNNLAAAYPEKVQEMDRMMEEYLKAAGTAVPLVNPAFDPAQYRPEEVGVQKGGLKVEGAAKAKNPAAKPVAGTTASGKPAGQSVSGPAVGGWLASGTCTLEKADGAVVVNSTGSDPYFFVQKITSSSGGPFTFRLRMKSDSSGGALVYFNKPFGKDHTVGFPVKHDGEWHEYEVAIQASNLDALRLDPSTAPGRIEIDWIRIEKDAGTVVQEWTF
jgi:arylsulfatase A-like enzyme